MDINKWIAEHIYKMDMSPLCDWCSNKKIKSFTWKDYYNCRCSALPIHRIPQYSSDLYLSIKLLNKVLGSNYKLEYSFISDIYNLVIKDAEDNVLTKQSSDSLSRAICLSVVEIKGKENETQNT